MKHRLLAVIMSVAVFAAMFAGLNATQASALGDSNLVVSAGWSGPSSLSDGSLWGWG